MPRGGPRFSVVVVSLSPDTLSPHQRPKTPRITAQAKMPWDSPAWMLTSIPAASTATMISTATTSWPGGRSFGCSRLERCSTCRVGGTSRPRWICRFMGAAGTQRSPHSTRRTNLLSTSQTLCQPTPPARQPNPFICIYLRHSSGTPESSLIPTSWVSLSSKRGLGSVLWPIELASAPWAERPGRAHFGHHAPSRATAFWASRPFHGSEQDSAWASRPFTGPKQNPAVLAPVIPDPPVAPVRLPLILPALWATHR